MPGLALFYGGLVKSENVLSVLMHCFGIACVASVTWLGIGYSIAFSSGNPFFGDLSQIFLLNMARDSMAGEDTVCEPILCSENERVSNKS